MNTKKFWVILLLATLVYTANFWGTSIYILDEAKNASCAMEMYHNNDLIVPTFNGVLRTDKPPLHYYFMMAAYNTFGVNPFSARLFSVIAGILTVLSVFFFTKKILGESVAFLSSLVMITSLQLVIQFHLAVPDPYLILFMTISLFLFYDGFHFSKSKSMLIFYITIGIAFLAKGLIAIVIPGLVIPLYLLLQKQFTLEGIRKLKLFPGMILFLLVAIPWYAAVGYYTKGEWLEGFFLKHNVDRFTATMEGHKGFFMAPFVIVIVALLPFSMFIIQALRYGWSKRIDKPFLTFCMITALIIPAFFSLSKTILPSYPAPALPFLAVILGFYLHDIFLMDVKDKYKQRIYISFIVYTVIMMCVPVLIYFALNNEADLQMLKPMSLWFSILPIGALIGFWFYHKERREVSLYTIAISWIGVILLFFYYSYPQLDKANPVTQSITILNSSVEPVVYYGSFNPAYVFALKSKLTELHTPGEVVRFLRDNPNGHVITYKKYLSSLGNADDIKIDFSQKDLFERGETVILSKRKD